MTGVLERHACVCVGEDPSPFAEPGQLGAGRKRSLPPGSARPEAAKASQ